MTCKGVCIRYKATGGAMEGRYCKGQSRCDVCNGIWIMWEGHYCPCCNYKLRKNPRKRSAKERLLKVRM